MATDWEYNAACNGGGDEDNGEQEDYYDYYSGCNCALTNNHNNQAPTMHYSMMMVKSNEVVTAGPKYFPVDMYDDSDDETTESGDDQNDNKTDEINSTCKCTEPDKQSTTTFISKNKKAIGVIANKNKNTVQIADALRTDTNDNNTHTRLLRPRPHWRRRVQFKTNDEAVRDAAAGDSIHEKEWHGITRTNEMTNDDNTTTLHHHDHHTQPLCTEHYNDTTTCQCKHVLRTARTATHTLSRASQHHTTVHTGRLSTDSTYLSSLISCSVARPPRHSTMTGGYYSACESVRHNLVASENSGTRASRLIVNGGHASDAVGVSQRRLNGLLPYPQDASQTQLRCRGQPQPQRCEDPCNASKESLVIAPGNECQGEGSGEWVGLPPRQGPYPNSPLCVFRRIRKQVCIQHTLSHHSVRRLDGRGGTTKTPPPPPRTLVNSGVGCLVSRRQSGTPLAARLVLVVIRPPAPLVLTTRRKTEKLAKRR